MRCARFLFVVCGQNSWGPKARNILTLVCLERCNRKTTHARVSHLPLHVFQVNSKYPTLPFTLRAFDDEKSARMGVVECQKNELMTPYPVMMEKDGAQVVHIKFTLLLLPSGTVRVTEATTNPAHYGPSEVELPEEVKAVLALSSKTNKKKKKKGKGEAAAAEPEA